MDRDLNAESEVRSAMKGELFWPPSNSSDGGESRRAAALDEFEEASGLLLPEAYRYIAVHHPMTNADVRWVSDIDLPTKVPIGSFALHSIDVIASSYARLWRDGEFFVRALSDYGSGMPAPVLEWAKFLYPLFDSDDELVYLDFRFDASNPPLVSIRVRPWSNLPPEATAVFVADDLLSYLRLEPVTEDNQYDRIPSDSPTARCVRWTDWRNHELIPACRDE